MTIDPKLGEGARNAVRVCMAVKAEDRAMILTDNETQEVAQALANEVAAVGAPVKLCHLESYGARPLTSAPENLLSDVDAFKPTVTFYVASAQAGEYGLRRELSGHLFQKHKVRHAHMVGITADLMRQGMRADYHQIYQLTMQIYDRVQTASKIQVTSPIGTDLTAKFDPALKWVPCHGLYHEVGSWGNLPEGEVFTCPANAEGVIVAQVLGDHFSTKYGLLEHPVTFQVVNSWVEQVLCEDKELQAEVWDWLDGAENGRRVGEFAIGTNTAVTELSGNLLQDEKIPGVHVAFGNPFPHMTGADWTSTVHVDVLSAQCSIKLDDQVLMVDGKFQL